MEYLKLNLSKVVPRPGRIVERRSCSTSLLIVIVVGSLLQSRCLVLGEETCMTGVSNYTKLIWKEYTVRVSSVKSRTVTIHPNCNLMETFCGWLKYCDNCTTKYRTEYYMSYEHKARSIETYEVTCCYGYTNDSNGTCTLDCKEGTYGENCTHNCSCHPTNAYTNCEKETGHCTCKPGWQEPTCTEECDDNFYGINCTNVCDCQNTGTCNTSTGCMCTPGWTGQFCETACAINTYGMNCYMNCTCNENETCSAVDGKCNCKPGWIGTICQYECPDWMYGEGCSNNCTCDISHSDGCSNVNGHCDCHSGYIGDCSEECPFGYYGQDCSANCSMHCINTIYCDPVNGACICLGNKGDNCSQACDNGMYGVDCNMTCTCNSSHSKNTCNPVTGQCRCLAGWEGESCKTAETNKQDGPNDINNTTVIAAAASAGGVGLVFVIVVVCIVVRKRRNSPLKETNELPQRNTNVEGMPTTSGERKTDSDVHTYDDLEDQIRESYIDFNDFVSNTTDNDASERVSECQCDRSEESHYQQLQTSESRVYSQLLKDTPVTDTTYEIPVVSSKTGPISE